MPHARAAKWGVDSTSSMTITTVEQFWSFLENSSSAFYVILSLWTGWTKESPRDVVSITVLCR